ncbi:glycosyltransferase family 4 protein [Phragmitibacter flavus]|nr:glycosyltransferase family 1 protein [Phragmitibacter flavus]
MIVTDTFPPDINGVARTLQMWAHGLSARGHRVTVVTTTEEAREANSRKGVEVLAMPALPIPGYQGIRMGVASRRQFEELIEIKRPDAMYVAVESLMGLNAVRAAGRAGVPVVSGFHTNFHTYSQDYRLPVLKNGAEWYLRYLHNRTARTLTPSESTAEQLRALGIENVGVLGRGVDTLLFNPQRRDTTLRQSWGADDSTPVALFVGRIAAEKNLPLVVKAFRQIVSQQPGARCVFVGDGPLSAALQEEHPDFIHAGARTGEDLARHYASADLFIFPSITETFGNVITEALTSGLVTVTYDYAAARQFIRNGENGFTAPYEDETVYLERVTTALTHWNDSAVRIAAADTSKRLSWDAIIAQFEQELSNARPSDSTTSDNHTRPTTS